MKYKTLITGASSGLGLELSKKLAKQSSSLILTGRNILKLLETQKELVSYCSVSIIEADLNLQIDRANLLLCIEREKPTLIINAAGIGLYGNTIELPDEMQMNILKTNVEALTEICIKAAKVMHANKLEGVIMNISSAAAFFHYPLFAIYSASKAYVNHFSQSLDAELSPYGIRILVCCPGQISTEFRKKAARGIQSDTNKSIVMSVEKAANLLVKQIEQKKNFQVIDLKYKFLVAISRICIPEKLIQKVLKSEILKRISKKE